MPETDRREFDLMLNEKDHVDGQISSFLDLQIKILTFLFAGLAVALGWVFKEPGTASEDKALILVGTAASACFGILLSIGAYATALAYIYYKHHVLGESFRRMLFLSAHPFQNRPWATSPGGRVLNVATGLLWLLVFLFTLWLLIAAWHFGNTQKTHVLIIICAGLLGLAMIAACFLLWAIRKTTDR